MRTSESSPAAAGKTQDRILLVGRRNGAIAAARRCGLRPVVIDAQPRREQAPNAFGGSGKNAVAEAVERFSKRPPVSVAAVATGSVMAAAAIREHFSLPGLSSATARQCHDKLVMKKAISAARIPCAPWREVDGTTNAEDLIAQLGLPLVLKMPISSGGRGVWICTTLEDARQRLHPGWLAEGFVEGVEMSVESFRSQGVTVFRNQTRYLKPGWANIVPAGWPTERATEIDALAERVHEALGIHTGISHMEVFLTKAGPVFGEIAARPPGGYLMDLIQRSYGFDPWEALLRLSLGEEFPFPPGPIRYCGVWILHPGEGRVREVAGLDEALALDGVAEVSCRLQVNEEVGPRIGSGQSKGRILAEATTAQACAEILTTAVGLVRMTMDQQP